MITRTVRSIKASGKMAVSTSTLDSSNHSISIHSLKLGKLRQPRKRQPHYAEPIHFEQNAMNVMDDNTMMEMLEDLEPGR